MKSIYWIIVALLCSGFFFQQNKVCAQTDFFWSFNELNDGASNGPASNSYSVGAKGSLFLYYSTNGPANSDLRSGALIDIAVSKPGVIEFTGAEILDFPIFVGPTPIGTRWGGVSGGGAQRIDGQFINEFGAFTITGIGIRESNNGSGAFSDSGYDFGADAFLFARINFKVIGSSNGVGPVEIIAQAGNGMIVDGDDCNATVVPATFGSALISAVSLEDFPLADVNQDLQVNLQDVAPFVELLISNEYQVEADTNCDGEVNLLDVQGFVDILSQPAPDNPPPPEPQKDLPGDLNCDGVINVLDCPCFFGLLGGESPCNPVTADVNQDGVINLLDASALIDLISANK